MAIPPNKPGNKRNISFVPISTSNGLFSHLRYFSIWMICKQEKEKDY